MSGPPSRAGGSATAVTPAVAALREWADGLRRTALEAVRWDALTPADRRRVESLTQALADGILRGPQARAVAAAGRDDAGEVVAGLRTLFPLEVGGRT